MRVLAPQVPPGEYQNIIMRCNTALRSVFFRFRIWIFFYIAYMLFTIFWIIDLNSCYDCYDDRGFDPVRCLALSRVHAWLLTILSGSGIFG